MMYPIYLSWAVGSGQDRQSGNKSDAKWNDALNVLKEAIAKEYGTVQLDLISAPEAGPQNLQLQTEKGHYLVFLTEDDDEDSSVRTHTNCTSESKEVPILGNLWSLAFISIDSEIIIRIFYEVFHTGNVSRDLLD
ncbi:MAG: DUF6911 family protein [Angustibacter sp.]